ncbi:MAG: YidC/Oxa1 family membrane protein insertase [Rhodobacteraceae bacterium]|nr:YidC/Oxa1 family membrane protein insertase [Paracoccaceae bacterium]
MLFTGCSVKIFRIGLGGAGALALQAGSAMAIPSPELVIGSVSSLGQVFALGAAMLGGGAALAGSRAKGRTAAGKKSKLLVRGGLSVLALCILSLGFNIWQYNSAKTARLTHLQATLNRPASKIRDKTLKVMSYDNQSENPLGISTGKAAELLAKLRNGDRSTLFLDVREGGENQMGSLPMSRHIRFPDLQATQVDTAGKKVVLFCHNGNRSSETCEKLAAQGIDCRFIAGGIEKWIVEGREFSDDTVRGLSDLRAMPPYLNDTVLLDTEQVKTLVEQQDVQFVDLRYPADFATGHLPNAVNITLRAMPTDQLLQAIDALPSKPIVAACYDRRSCFMSQVLGLELAQKGLDYRGRYTVPWEYFVPPTPKPHVAAWLAVQQTTLWQRAVSTLAAGLLWVGGRSHILLAVFLLALISRILILPIAIKAEKDQIISAKVKPELAVLKARLKDDPQRMSRAMREFYAKHGLTPLRNMLALAFLPLMMLGLAAVEKAANGAGPVLWLETGGTPDPFFALPLLFTLLGGAYLQMALASSKRGRILCWMIGAPLLFVLVFRISALGNIYLCFALALLLMQRAFVTGAVSRLLGSLHQLRLARQINNLTNGIIPLSATDYLHDCGNKALRLSQMAWAGISVPQGVVLNHLFLQEFATADAATREKRLDQIWALAGRKLLAVRSSAAAEDGDSQSFAGVFESELEVDRANLEGAIDRVYASFTAARVDSYASEDEAQEYNILVQQMVMADYSGVLFSRDPQAAGMMVLEYVKGTADDLVSGRVTPTTLRMGRISGATEAESDSPVNLQELRRIGLQAEALFDAPQDIEWTSQNGIIRLVQSRDITTLGVGSDADKAMFSEWSAVTDRFSTAGKHELVLELDEMSEVLPRPSPLSMSYMQEIWAPGGSVDLACRRLGLSYNVSEDAPSHLMTVFGRLYSDVALKLHNTVELNAAAVRRLRKVDTEIEHSYRDVFMPEFTAKVALWNAVDFTKLTDAALRVQLAEIYSDFVHWTHTEIETINIAASYYTSQAQKACDARGVSAQELLAGEVSFSPAGLIQQAALMPSKSQQMWLQQQMGHRSVFDYELSEPRYSEIPDTLDMLLRPALIGGTAPQPAQTIKISDPELSRLIERSRRYQALKEEAKHNALQHLSVIRRMVLALDHAFGNDGLVFYLGFEQLLDEGGDIEALKQEAAVRRTQMRLFNKTPSLPARITLDVLELASNPFAINSDGSAGDANGSWVSGSGPITGRAFVVDYETSAAGSPLEGFEEGDILVCSMVHPMWLSYVLKSAGVVSEVGGWLSHMSIVAREHGIPMLVGADGLQRFDTGQMLEASAEGDIRAVEMEPQLKVVSSAE